MTGLADRLPGDPGPSASSGPGSSRGRRPPWSSVPRERVIQLLETDKRADPVGGADRRPRPDAEHPAGRQQPGEHPRRLGGHRAVHRPARRGLGPVGGHRRGDLGGAAGGRDHPQEPGHPLPGADVAVRGPRHLEPQQGPATGHPLLPDAQPGAVPVARDRPQRRPRPGHRGRHPGDGRPRRARGRHRRGRARHHPRRLHARRPPGPRGDDARGRTSTPSRLPVSIADVRATVVGERPQSLPGDRERPRRRGRGAVREGSAPDAGRTRRTPTSAGCSGSPPTCPRPSPSWSCCRRCGPAGRPSPWCSTSTAVSRASSPSRTSSRNWWANCRTSSTPPCPAWCRSARTAGRPTAGLPSRISSAEIGVQFPDGPYTTVAGLVLDLAGRIPVVGDAFDDRRTPPGGHPDGPQPDRPGPHRAPPGGVVPPTGNMAAPHGTWRSLAARSVRDAEAAGSNPAVPTKIYPEAGERSPASAR